MPDLPHFSPDPPRTVEVLAFPGVQILDVTGPLQVFVSVKRDVPDAEVRFVDSGHFALETHAGEIGAAMRDFLDRHLG